jgi:D-alanyl-D-alanine carboxypeptidase/D-alanyl-D-alanine-endopeptidase (penicillin-binding protein 4)
VLSLESGNSFPRKVKLKIIIKIFLTSICLFVFTLNIFTQPDNQHQESSIQDLTSGINKLINDPFFEKTTIAIDIFDLTDSISLFKHNEKPLLHPASNMKILTSIAGLMNLGKDYQFKTQLFHTGVIEDETLFGDLFVVGGFDPNFKTEDLDSLVRIVQSLGIKNIEGGIYADVSNKDSLYWGKGWMWDDDPDPDAPYLSALNINDNSIEVFVEGSEIGSPAKVTLIPQTDFVDIINNTKTVSANSRESFKIARDWVNKKNTIIVEGEVPKVKVIDSTAQTEKVNLVNPEKYFLTLFKEHLEQKEIQFVKPSGIKILEANSVYLAAINRSIDTVLSEVNKDSDNLDAEMLLYAIAFNDSGAPANADNGLAAVKRFIDTLGFNSDDYYLADGSGVSHYNLVSAELLLETFKYIYYKRKDLFPLFYNSLAVAGVNGTLRNRMKSTSAQNNVRAKTGTLNGVSNLSGYVTSKNGHLLAYSIMMQNFVEEHSKARSFQDTICMLLAEYE